MGARTFWTWLAGCGAFGALLVAEQMLFAVMIAHVYNHVVVEHLSAGAATRAPSLARMDYWDAFKLSVSVSLFWRINAIHATGNVQPRAWCDAPIPQSPFWSTSSSPSSFRRTAGA